MFDRKGPTLEQTYAFKVGDKFFSSKDEAIDHMAAEALRAGFYNRFHGHDWRFFDLLKNPKKAYEILKKFYGDPDDTR